MPIWHAAGALAPERSARPAVPSLPPTAITFDAGFAPVPQDPNFQNWINAGWPTGPIPSTPSGGTSIALGDYRQWVEMYVGVAGQEPKYYSTPMAVNGGSDSAGSVQIRLAAGPGAWQGTGGPGVDTTYGEWSVNNDGRHVSYRPFSRTSLSGELNTSVVDTEAQYRWSPDGLTWSEAATLKMTLVHPPTAVLFLESYSVIFDNPAAANTTPLQNAINAAVAAEGTLTQRDGSKRFTWQPPAGFPDAHRPTDTLHFYNLRIDKDVPAPGDKFHRCILISWNDTPRDPINMWFCEYNGKAGLQNHSPPRLDGNDDPITELWVHDLPGAEYNGGEFHQLLWVASFPENVPFVNRPAARVRYCLFYNGPCEPVCLWNNADVRTQWCSFIGGARGSITNSGSNVIYHVQDVRVHNLLKTERDFALKDLLYTEADAGFGYFELRWERILLDQGLTMFTARHLESGWMADADMQVNDIYTNLGYGDQINIGPGATVTNCRLTAGTHGGGEVAHFIEVGYNGAGGQKTIRDCEIIINNRSFQPTGLPEQVVLPTDPCGAGIDWFVLKNQPTDPDYPFYGWTDVIEDSTFRIAEGMTGHPGAFYGLKVKGQAGAPAPRNTVRLINVTFQEAADGKKFTFAVDGLSSTRRLLVEYDQDTATNNAALISPPPEEGAPRMWGPFADATLIGVPMDGLVHARKCALSTSTAAGVITGTHTDFPVLFTQANLPSEMFDADGPFPAQNGGGDIRFSSDAAGTNLLPAEVVTFVTNPNPASGYAEIWVKLPSISPSSTTIYVWYNVPGSASQPAVFAPNGRNAVWYLSQYILVTHDLITDSTGNFTLTPTGTAAATNPFLRPGLGAKSFGGAASDRVTTNLTAHNPLRTYQIWANRSGAGGASFGRLLCKSLTPPTNSESWHNDETGTPDGYEFIRNGTPTHGEWTYARPAVNIWTRESVTYDSGVLSNDPAAYRNGTLITPFSFDQNPSTAIVNDTQPYVIGNDSTGASNWAGLLAEVWISNAIRSADRIATEYSNQNAPGSFITVGTPSAP